MPAKTRYALVAQLQGVRDNTHVVIATAPNLHVLRKRASRSIASYTDGDSPFHRIWENRNITRRCINRCTKSATPEGCLSIGWWREGTTMNWLYVTLWCEPTPHLWHESGNTI
jgi:hypothetical protein